MEFSFSNQDQHVQIVTQLQQQRGLTVPLFPLDPIPFFNLAGWAIVHQQMHSAFTEALGIVGSDLTSVNLRDRAQLGAFILLHADEHRQAAQILGIS